MWKSIVLPEDIDCIRTFLTVTQLRICDLGGWTDTWFSKSGNVCNLSVLTRRFGHNGPFRGIDILLNEFESKKQKIQLLAMDASFDTEIFVKDIENDNYDNNNLLTSTPAVLPLGLIKNKSLSFRIMSPVEPGASMGASASVSAGLIISFFAHYDFTRLRDKQEIAEIAFSVEKEIMNLQTGTQDQFSAVYGLGAQKITIIDYPRTEIEKIELSQSTKEKLENGLVTVFIGRHNSSDTHSMVIEKMEKDEINLNSLEPLRQCAIKGAKALAENDLIKYGGCLSDNTAYQKELHPNLVGDEFEGIIDLAVAINRPLGYKVNGAGGTGGT
ncbi:hypothetical protein CO100_01230, partial [Candidatus Berkelbacteria bacterium CG_4_9_14_3_um_filter_33_5]